MKKIPMPKTSSWKSWKEFVQSVHKSIGRQLGKGIIQFKK